MKILYIVPGIMSKTNLGTDELTRRKKILQSYAGKDVMVDITDIKQGPSSIESAYEEYLSIPETVVHLTEDLKPYGLPQIITSEPGFVFEMLPTFISGSSLASIFIIANSLSLSIAQICAL